MEKNNCNNTNSKHSPDDTSTTVSSEIDKSMFRRSFIVPAINVPTKDCSKFVKIFKNHTFKAPRIQPVQKIKGNEDKRKILLESNLGKELQHLSETKKTMLQELPYELSSQEIEIGYEHMSVEEVLRQILPQNLDPITSFESVGHIAHVNLSKEHIPYRFLIGKVLIDKVPSLSMVVNKTGSINSKYRAFDMEIIGQRPDGKKDFDVEVKEHGIRYRFDYSQVFWNSRLATEHQRIPKLLTKHNVIADMFAGVGPFAIPAARNTGCITHANDLNPNSVEWLKTNVTLNRVQDKVYTYNMDGREFIKHLINNNIIFDTVLMNLPASAAEFLDVFINAFPEEWPQMPKIYCYTFVRGKETAHKEAIQIIGDFLFQDERYREHRSQFEENSDLSTYLVRDVAPNKFMVCVSFTFPSFLGYNGKRHSPHSQVPLPSPKKVRLQNKE
eukprot:gb/GECH01012107.1/.p1 GENE.gb/GECH01012107.1/~~gb/GECH01012107.1/.p1  ORF type:complete len:442 (+),score=89.88 gb/GECH01012107.1/:1-1326(+)